VPQGPGIRAAEHHIRSVGVVALPGSKPDPPDAAGWKPRLVRGGVFLCDEPAGATGALTSHRPDAPQ
jgi:hypothetical protein